MSCKALGFYIINNLQIFFPLHWMHYSWLKSNLETPLLFWSYVDVKEF